MELLAAIIGATLLYIVLSMLGVLKPPRNSPTQVQRDMHDRCADYPDIPGDTAEKQKERKERYRRMVA